MSLTTSEMTPADIAAVTGGNNGMFGNEGGAFWVLILFLFAWGRGGYGFGGGTGGASDNYVLASDFAQVERKLDTVNAGLCDGFYAQAQLVNGVQSSLATQGYETRNAIQAAQIAQMQSANALQAQLAQCCCDTKAGIADINYNMATHACSTQRTIENGTRDLLENQNANARAILDALTAQRIEQKDAKIAEQAQMINGLQLAASQARQNEYLIGQLKQCPIPAYTVPNPYVGCGCGCS